MISEFDFIQYIKKSFSLGKVGDDCSILPKDDSFDMVVTTDMLIEDIDFRLEWTSPELLGHKALAISLSDVAAVGAEPYWAMLSIGIPERLWETDFVQSFYEGWIALSKDFGVELVGGDISRSPDKFLVDSIVGGEVPKGKAILRSGAEPGDAIFVTGSLGGAAGGLRLLENGVREADAEDWQRELIRRQLRPWPRVSIGKYLLENQLASSLIDLSDGLSSDIHHVCVASGVGAELDSRLLPFDKNLKHLIDSPDETLDLILNGGEDFELLFTVPQERVSLIERREFVCVGVITQNAGKVELIDRGRSNNLPASGYRHF